MNDSGLIDAIRDAAQRIKTDYKQVFWNLKAGEKATVRIVPSKYTPDNPFTEVNRHAWDVAKGALVLTMFDQKDPIVEHFEEHKNDWEYAKKFKTTTSYTVPVIVRGEEHKGVRIWTISKTVLGKIIELIQNVDYGDITDVKKGRDLKLTKSTDQFPKTSVIAKGKPTLLSPDENEVEEWLQNQPEPINCFPKYNYDKLKEKLDKYNRV